MASHNFCGSGIGEPRNWAVLIWDIARCQLDLQSPEGFPRAGDPWYGSSFIRLSSWCWGRPQFLPAGVSSIFITWHSWIPPEWRMPERERGRERTRQMLSFLWHSFILFLRSKSLTLEKETPHLEGQRGKSRGMVRHVSEAANGGFQQSSTAHCGLHLCFWPGATSQTPPSPTFLVYKTGVSRSTHLEDCRQVPQVKQTAE